MSGPEVNSKHPRAGYGLDAATRPRRQSRRQDAHRAVAAIVFLLWAHGLTAGNWHTGAGIVCTDCHTQHSSQNNQPMRTDNVADPAAKLLLRATPLELCLSCHDGSKVSSPDVVTPVSYVDDSAAGAFPNSGGTATTIAHHLNNPTPEVPPGGTIPMVLTCTTCHDPHGNENYRNLRSDPTQTGLTPVSVLANESVIANGSNPANVYVPSNIIYKSGVSLWCEKCHGEPLAGSDHPVDRTIFGAIAASYARWSTGTTTTVMSVGGTPEPRVPAHSPTDDVYPSSDDQVMCLSCHKAHGSANWKTLIYADGVTQDSTCQECHNQ